MGKIDAFVKRYRFPIHLVIVYDRLIGGVSSLFWTFWARWALWVQGCRAGRGFRADGRLIVRTHAKGGVELGDGVLAVARHTANLVGMTGPNILCCYGEGRISVGEGTGMSSATISSRASVRIGRRCLVGGNARIYDHDFHSLDPDHRRDRRSDNAHCRSAPVEIGDEVFIGAHAMILKGVTLGDRCVVGAGSVVLKGEYPPGCTVAGNPARIVRRGGRADS